MCNGGKWLLAAVIIFTAASQVAAVSVTLHEVTPAVDDMYKGCSPKAMEKFISSGLLQKELGQDEEFQKIWKANENCSKLIPGKKPEHSVAISVYSDDQEHQDFLQRFDHAVEKMGVNISTYPDDFHFKSLHVLLMDSMTLMDPASCMSVYAATDEDNPPTSGSTLRFGSFITVYSDIKDMEKDFDLNDRVILNITTCFFVDLEAHSCSKQKKKLLLSPAELFTVADVKPIQDMDNDYTMVTLKHLKLNSEQKGCIFSGAPAVVSTQWFVSVFVAVIFFNC